MHDLFHSALTKECFVAEDTTYKSKCRAEKPSSGEWSMISKIIFKPVLSSTLFTTENPNDVQDHIAELRKEWRSKQPLARTVSHVKLLLKRTQDYRVQQLKNQSTGRIGTLMDEFPCFENGQFACTRT